MEFYTYRMSDVFERFSSGKNITEHKISDSGKYPVYGGNGLRGYTDTSNFKGECILIGRQGAKCGNVRYFNGEGYMTDHAIVGVCKPNHNTQFMNYALASLDLNRLSGQAAQPGLSVGMLKKQKILLPSLENQAKIAKILFRYNNLIENNNRRIALLEKAAQELYKEWFVRFRFPGFEGVEFENGFPKNWLQFRLGKKMTFVRGKSYSSADIQDGDKVLLSMNNIRPYGGFIRDFTRVYGGKYQDKHVIKYGDLLMSITDMTQDRRIIGYVGMFDSNRTDCIMSTHLIKIETDIDHLFALNFFNVSGLSKMIAEFATGANVLGLTDSILKRIKAVLPPDDLIEQYGKTVKPYYDMITVLKNENDNLIKQRDLLLPRLMSGKLEV